MPKNNIDFLSLLLLIGFSVKTNCQDGFVNPCDNEPPSPEYYKTAIYANETCLFTMEFVTDDMNRWGRFEMHDARSDCNFSGATLPRVTTVQKNQFIVQTFSNISYFTEFSSNKHLVGIALDIWVKGGQFVWGDGRVAVPPVPVRGDGYTISTFKYASIQISPILSIQVGEWNYTNTKHLGNGTVGILCEMPWKPQHAPRFSNTKDRQMAPFISNECAMFGIDCYFILTEESKKFNVKSDTDSSISFDWDAAVLACSKRNAFPPIIESEYENNFINRLNFAFFNETKWQNARIPLALNRINDSYYMWSNKNKMFYEPTKWYKNKTAKFTYMVRNVTDDPTWVDTDNPISEPVAVVCKKYQLGDLNQPEPGIRLPVTPCDQTNASKYTKTVVFKNVCYFVIDSATDNAHSNTSGGRSLEFWQWVAEASCQMENAWALAVDDASVVSFIKVTFNSSDFTDKPLAGIYLGIEKWAKNGRYYWTADRNLEVNLVMFGGQLKWTTTNPYYDFTYLDINSYDWHDSLKTLTHGLYIGVLCMKPLVYEKPTTTTTTTTQRTTTTIETTTELQPDATTSFETAQNQTASASNVGQGFEKMVLMMVSMVTKVCF